MSLSRYQGRQDHGLKVSGATRLYGEEIKCEHVCAGPSWGSKALRPDAAMQAEDWCEGSKQVIAPPLEAAL